jgi:hypothetical protein
LEREYKVNIFILDNDVEQSAKYHCDQHVNKMILEAAQIICTVRALKGAKDSPYKATHPKHPCTIWAGRTLKNYLYVLDYAHYLNEEAKSRYKKKVNHKSWDVLQELTFPDFDLIERTEFARAMPEQFKRIPDTVEAYREYYKTKEFATWKTGKPEWL